MPTIVDKDIPADVVFLNVKMWVDNPKYCGVITSLADPDIYLDEGL